MLKLPKGLKKKKKKSKKDQELFTEEELEQYKRDLKAKQEAAANKSDAGESDAASDVEGATTSSSNRFANEQHHSHASNVEDHHHQHQHQQQQQPQQSETGDEEWAKFKALTSGVDNILHKTQDELDRIKKESFYQRLPSAAEQKKLEEEKAAAREQARLERERQLAAEREANRDKLAEAVVELSESDDEQPDEVDDIFATDYIEAITSGEVQLGVVPDSPVLEFDDGPDPFDTAYAEKVIVGADKAKGGKKLVSLGAAVEVLSGRVDREHALALANPKRKLRKGIQNLLLSESVDLADGEPEFVASEPQHNLLDDLVDDEGGSAAPIDLSVSLHLHLIKPQKLEEEDENDNEVVDGDFAGLNPDLAEFDALKDPEDDEFAELAAESLTKKEEVTIVTQVVLAPAEVFAEAAAETSWAEFAPDPAEEQTGKPKRPPPPVRPATGPHIVPGAIYVSDDEEDNLDDDPFNTNYAEQVIKKTTVLEQDDDFDPRAEESHSLAAPARDLLAGSATDLSKVVPAPLAPTLSIDQEQDFDPFDTSAVSALVQPKATELRCLERELNLQRSLSDPDFDPRGGESVVTAVQPQISVESSDFDSARRKSSLSLNICPNKSVGFSVPVPDLLGVGNEAGLGANKKPLTPYYAPRGEPIAESEDPFDTSYVPESKLSDIELKHIEADLISKESTLKHSLSDPDFNPRAPPTSVPAEVLLAVDENINIKVLTPAQERKQLQPAAEELDPFDTSIAANLQPGQTELKLLENELLPDNLKPSSIDVLDTQSDAQELGLGDKVLTPRQESLEHSPQDFDPFDTSIAENLAPGETEIKLLESELIER
ncbi:stnA [Drosophila busckii]|uniref:StnA n=1 Tax=Drosophila busckii TaxID=30019 RepID=A0A0M4ETU2_DROBS|nr:protein stoned-A [Drosophila busckii]XP_017851933.1 protein stoned-A [Drosophila busckii]XP_017851934.1 protein stoned-A [Drosophila busckii]XP_017851935.1 protein stoned-A [Drosophila busckii]XP_017851936.1 protein stoned-A [Drosophila busckii]ALC50015.1 stnA [Drosophila busckii]